MQQCAREDKISQLDSRSIGSKLSDLLKEIALSTGLKVPFEINKKGDEDMSAFCLLFTKFLMSHYGNITISEVKLAFRLNALNDLPGITGQGKETYKVDLYGPFLNLEHFGGVLSRYMKKRAVLAEKMSAEGLFKRPESEPPTQEQQDVDNRQFCNEYYRKWLNNEFSNVTPTYAHWVYNLLDRMQVIQLTIEQKKAYKERAVNIRNGELNEIRNGRDRYERKDAVKLLADHVTGALSDSEQEIIKAYAKRLALFEFFNQLKSQKRDKIFT